MLDQSIIGSTSDVYEFEVEKGAIRKFADAIGDDNPIYFDENYAKKLGFSSLVAPPTFPMTFTIPKPGINQLDKSRTLHGEQEFNYERPIVAGDILHCITKLVDAYEKEGKKGGKMTFFILETQGNDLEGNKIYTSRTTIIYR